VEAREALTDISREFLSTAFDASQARQGQTAGNQRGAWPIRAQAKPAIAMMLEASRTVTHAFAGKQRCKAAQGGSQTNGWPPCYPS
jgi:hypothetical protein